MVSAHREPRRDSMIVAVAVELSVPVMVYEKGQKRQYRCTGDVFK